MKNKELLKNLLEFKLQIIDHLLGMLPGETGTFAKQLQSNIISSIHEVTAGYLQKEETENKDISLKAVVIE